MSNVRDFGAKGDGQADDDNGGGDQGAARHGSVGIAVVRWQQ